VRHQAIRISLSTVPPRSELLDSEEKRDIIRGPALCDSAWHDSACTIATHWFSQEKKQNEKRYF